MKRKRGTPDMNENSLVAPRYMPMCPSRPGGWVGGRALSSNLKKSAISYLLAPPCHLFKVSASPILDAMLMWEGLWERC